MNLKQHIKNFIKSVQLIKDDFIWNRHISKVHKRLNINSSNLEKELISRHVQYWKQLKKKVNPKWFEVYYHITNNPDIRFAPEDIYFGRIENKLNNRELVLAYADKNFYDLFYQAPDLFPKTLLRNIDGFFYDKDYNPINIDNTSIDQFLSSCQKIIIKPSVDSGGGRKICLFTKKDKNFYDKNNQVLELDFLKKNFARNYLIQEYLSQNEYLAKFNDSSVNTIRIFTYRSVKNDQVHALHAVLRIGKKGNYLDDQNVGGVACKINDDLTLNNFATNYFGEKFEEFNGIKFSSAGKVPFVNEIKQLAVNLAIKNIHSRVIGFDFTIDSQNQIKLVEINHLWTGINFFQMNGDPVLGKFTDEVVEFCKYSI